MYTTLINDYRKMTEAENSFKNTFKKFDLINKVSFIAVILLWAASFALQFLQLFTSKMLFLYIGIGFAVASAVITIVCVRRFPQLDFQKRLANKSLKLLAIKKFLYESGVKTKIDLKKLSIHCKEQRNLLQSSLQKQGSTAISVGIIAFIAYFITNYRAILDFPKELLAFFIILLCVALFIGIMRKLVSHSTYVGTCKEILFLNQLAISADEIINFDINPESPLLVDIQPHSEPIQNCESKRR